MGRRWGRRRQIEDKGPGVIESDGRCMGDQTPHGRNCSTGMVLFLATPCETLRSAGPAKKGAAWVVQHEAKTVPAKCGVTMLNDGGQHHDAKPNGPGDSIDCSIITRRKLVMAQMEQRKGFNFLPEPAGGQP